MNLAYPLCELKQGTARSRFGKHSLQRGQAASREAAATTLMIDRTGARLWYGQERANGITATACRVSLLSMIPRYAPEFPALMTRAARPRLWSGDTHVEGKILSVFETSTEVIRKGKASKPTEFGKMVKIHEAENQIVIDFEVYDQKPSDSDLLIPSIEAHPALMGRTPHLVAADAGFYSAKNVAEAEEIGVKRVSVPNRSTKSLARRQYQKQRWFKKGQKWRTGCEGRISLLKRRHGLRRSLYKKDAGMKRWVGLGVIADNLINIGRAMAK